jgi:sulfatase maturation enzyme AslB (radical SAM superfamily)
MSYIEKKYIKNTLYKDIDFTDLENIEVLGGEPIISPGTAEFFKTSKELDILKNLTIQISTNGMEKPSGHVLTALLECKTLALTISIDGHGDYNNYIRSGSNFDQIVSNLEYYNTLIDIRNGDTKITVHTTISIYNVNQLDLLDNFISNQFPRFNKTHQVLQFPVFMSIKNTNQEYKDLVRPFIKNINVINYLDSNGEDMFGHFINFSNQLDELRNEHIANSNPLLTSYIEKYPKVNNSKLFLKESLKSIIG